MLKMSLFFRSNIEGLNRRYRRSFSWLLEHPGTKSNRLLRVSPMPIHSGFNDNSPVNHFGAKTGSKGTLSRSYEPRRQNKL